MGGTSLFANIRITTFDGRTFVVGKNPYANLGSILAGTFSRMRQDPLVELDDASFPEPAMEAVNSATLRDRFRAFLTAYLDKTLPLFIDDR